MTFNAADRKHVRQAEKAAKLAEAQIAGVVAEVTSTINGRAWYLGILKRCHVFATSFTGEALTSAYAEGERNIGLQLLGDLMAVCPGQYIEMMKEDHERSITSDRRQDSNGRDQGSDSADSGPGEDAGAEA